MKGPWLRLGARGVEYKRGDKWHGMEASRTWHILTALRGPDNLDYTLKEEYTARIRGLFCVWDNKGDRARIPAWIAGIVSTPRKMPPLGRRGQRHWRNHILSALDDISDTCGWPTWENTKS